MIKRITVKNFKSLLNNEIDFSGINLLTGINGLGKSTLIQTLLLIRQSYLQNFFPQKGILLNGNLVRLGKGKDVLNIATDYKEINFKFEFDNSVLDIFLEYNQDSDTLPLIAEKSSYSSVNFTHQLFTEACKYLNAERIPPKLAYQVSLFEVIQNGSIGIHGEFTPLLLALKKREQVKLQHALNIRARSTILLDQVSSWLNEISPGLNIDSNYLPDIDYANIIYKYEGNESLTYDFSAPNVGFGLTYVLPVITLILSSKPGDIIIIENPESHIHPHGQTKLGELLFLAAKDGIQLFIETHSDHILNGIRVAINKYKKDSELVKLLFFQHPENGEKHYVDIISPKIDDNGRIDIWPKGFFDEWEKTLINLI
jgi:predicted ATPase